MIIEVRYKCLRCGKEWNGPLDKKKLRERTCSHCGSNSVRKLKAPPKNTGDGQLAKKPAASA